MKYNKKKAVTLIECIASMSVILIIFTCTFSYVKLFSKLTLNSTERYLNFEVNNLFSYAKEYCEYNKEIGTIKIYNNGEKNNKIKFTDSNNRTIRILNLPEYITFDEGYPYIKNYYINSYGKVEKSEIINLKYKKKDNIKVVIEAATNKIE